MRSSPIQLAHALHRNAVIIPGNGIQRTGDASQIGQKAERGYVPRSNHREVTLVEREYQIRVETCGQGDNRRVDTTERKAAIRLDKLPPGCAHALWVREDGTGFADIAKQPTCGALDNVFRDVTADLVFYGHHPAADYTGRARYFSPGSLG